MGEDLLKLPSPPEHAVLDGLSADASRRRQKEQIEQIEQQQKKREQIEQKEQQPQGQQQEVQQQQAELEELQPAQQLEQPQKPTLSVVAPLTSAVGEAARVPTSIPSPNGLRKVRELSLLAVDSAGSPSSAGSLSGGGRLLSGLSPLGRHTHVFERDGRAGRDGSPSALSLRGSSKLSTGMKVDRSSASMPDIASLDREVQAAASADATATLTPSLAAAAARLPSGGTDSSDCASTGASPSHPCRAGAPRTRSSLPPRPPRLQRRGNGSSSDSSSCGGSSRRLSCFHLPKRYDPHSSEITGFLIDLDGTVYRPDALIPGTRHFHEYMIHTGKQFVYLSNTGAKSSEAVRRKLRTARYCLSAAPLPDGTVFTAAEAQVAFMAENIPEGAKVFVMSGGGDFWYKLLQQTCPELLETWEVRTNLSEEEAKQWATIAAVHPRNPLVWVVLFVDGPLSSCPDPTTGQSSPADWSYELVRNCSYVLGHGAQLVYTADDSSNPAIDNAYGGYVWPQPGPGMFAAMLTRIMQPRGASRIHCLGKGGNAGKKYMMERAIQLLQEQGHSGDRTQIMMVGDRFDTDIRGGRSAGLVTCLVESGAHKASQQKEYPDDRADYLADGLGAMHALTYSPQIELPMVIRQPLRLWVLSFGNVVRADAAAKGSNLKLDECLREFYKREAGLTGTFGKHQLLKAFDEIGLEVSEHQVDACLSGLLSHGSAKGGSISFQLFSTLMRHAMQNVGIDLRTARVSERTINRLRQAVRSAGRRDRSSGGLGAWRALANSSPMSSAMLRRSSTAISKSSFFTTKAGRDAAAAPSAASGKSSPSSVSSAATVLSPALPSTAQPPADAAPSAATRSVDAPSYDGTSDADRSLPSCRPPRPRSHSDFTEARPSLDTTLADATLHHHLADEEDGRAPGSDASGSRGSARRPSTAPATPASGGTRFEREDDPAFADDHDAMKNEQLPVIRSASSPPTISPNGSVISLVNLADGREAALPPPIQRLPPPGAVTEGACEPRRRHACTDEGAEGTPAAPPVTEPTSCPAEMPRSVVRSPTESRSLDTTPTEEATDYSLPRAPFSAPRCGRTLRRTGASSSRDLISGGALFSSPPPLFADLVVASPLLPEEAVTDDVLANSFGSGSVASDDASTTPITVPVVFGSPAASPAAADLAAASAPASEPSDSSDVVPCKRGGDGGNGA